MGTKFRFRVLHGYEAYAAQLFQPRADSVLVGYKPSGFCGHKGAADAITKPIRPDIELRMVEKPLVEVRVGLLRA